MSNWRQLLSSKSRQSLFELLKNSLLQLAWDPSLSWLCCISPWLSGPLAQRSRGPLSQLSWYHEGTKKPSVSNLRYWVPLQIFSPSAGVPGLSSTMLRELLGVRNRSAVGCRQNVCLGSYCVSLAPFSCSLSCLPGRTLDDSSTPSFIFIFSPLLLGSELHLCTHFFGFEF